MLFFFSIDSFDGQWRDPGQVSLLRLNTTWNLSLGTSRGLLCTSPSSESPDEFGWVFPGFQISWLLVDDPEFYLAVSNRCLAPQVKDTKECPPVERYWKSPVERAWELLSWETLSPLDWLIGWEAGLTSFLNEGRQKASLQLTPQPGLCTYITFT